MRKLISISKFSDLRDAGQAMLEYALLLAIIVGIAVTFFNFLENRFLGPNGLRQILFDQYSEYFQLEAPPNQRYKRFPIVR
ncbi:hypothetical protein N9N67_08385 [Bacteriovoracaceae bacterium]|nr:hypothetical protein [Bacteriovoracaceae bacterium]